jgi:hypothetical protein
MTYTMKTPTAPEIMGILLEDFLSEWLICAILLFDGVICFGDVLATVLTGASAGGGESAVELKKLYIS